MEKVQVNYKSQIFDNVKKLFNSFKRIFFGNVNSTIGSIIIIMFIFIGIFGALGGWRIEDASANSETFLSILFPLFILFIWGLSYYIFAHKQIIQPK